MPDVAPPVPDPKLKPKLSEQMRREGEREREVLVERDHSQSAPANDEQTPSPPTIPLNGD